MKRFLGFLLVVLGMVLGVRCNGANDVAGIDTGQGASAPTVTPHPRPTPNPCRQNPADCDDLRSASGR
ncbi:MAG TPA: hypothetical protein VH854_15685 [Thermoanaerobaculia bacterium]|nr:hypothetical protein [Thermoanaerobaculia bacterium]